MSNIVVKTPCGWEFDLIAQTLSWPAESLGPVAWPQVSQASQIYHGANYLASQQASRLVGDAFKKEWAEAADGRKVKDAPKDCVPDAKTPAYAAKLLAARHALFAKLVEGYEVGERAGAVDPFAEAVDDAARLWLQGVAIQYDWYSLPMGPKGKPMKVARDEDPYADPKGRYATFGDALAAFKVSDAPVVAKLIGKDEFGKPWPFKIVKGATVAQAIAAEAQRRVDEAKPKAAVALGGEGDAADVDF